RWGRPRAWSMGEDGAVNDQHRQLRVGLAQVDTRVGDLSGNAQLVRTWAAKAAASGAHLVVFPEMTLTGYPAEDLVLRESLARASEQALVDLAGALADDGLGDLAVVVGYLAHTEGAGAAAGGHPDTQGDPPRGRHPTPAGPRH